MLCVSLKKESATYPLNLNIPMTDFGWIGRVMYGFIIAGKRGYLVKISQKA